MNKSLPIGKLDSDLLQEIVFDKLTFRRDEVLTRPGIGEDCAVMDYGDFECVMSTDPITASVEDIGHLAIHVSCNDIASNGIEPIGLLLAVLLPEGTTRSDVEDIMDQVGKASRLARVEIIGGHTEITSTVKQPVIVSTAVGRALKGHSQSAKDMEVGDKILITKKAGLEGTGIIAKERDLSDFLTEEEIDTAKEMLNQVSVVPEGVIAGDIGTHGMHDVTEGGILGAVWEMCHISGLGASIDEEAVPVAEVTKKICDFMEINYLRLISSGSMMIVCSPDKEGETKAKMQAAGIEITTIGEIKEGNHGILFKDGRVIDPPAADEIYKVVG